MGLFKVLGGVALGVGAVAAAPFTGGGSILGAASIAGSLAGVGTVAGAVAAGAAGGVVGAALNDMEDDERRVARQSGFEDGIKKGNAETIKRFENILNNHKRRDDFLIATTAMGFAMAQSDGYVSYEEKDEIDHFLGNINANPNIPGVVKREVTRVSEETLDSTSFPVYLNHLNIEEIQTLREFVVLIAESDDDFSADEKQFLMEYDSYCESRGIYVN